MAKSFRFGVIFGGTFGAAEWTAAAREAEELGYSTIHFGDHFGMLDPLAALMVAGTATRKIRLGTYVLCNDFRHPAVLAREAATVDVLSGGRLELGLGAGYRVDEYEQTGIRFDGPAVETVRAAAGDRFDRLELNTMMTGPVVVTDDREAGAHDVLEFLRSGRYPIVIPDDFGVRHILDSPFYLIGTHAEIADQVVALRRRYGISYVTVMFMSLLDFSPVVEKLTDR